MATEVDGFGLLEPHKAVLSSVYGTEGQRFEILSGAFHMPPLIAEVSSFQAQPVHGTVMR